MAVRAEGVRSRVSPPEGMLADARQRSPTRSETNPSPRTHLPSHPGQPYSRWTVRTAIHTRTHPPAIVIQTSVALLGLIVVALVSLTGLIGVREGQPA